MRYISIYEALRRKENGKDVFLAQDVKTENGVILLNSIGNPNIPESLIHKLIEKGIEYIYIQDKLVGDIEIAPIVNEKIRREVFDELKNLGGNKDIKKIEANAVNIANSIIINTHLDPDIYTMDSSNHLFGHSLAVAELSANMLKFITNDANKLTDIVTASLLHDIGKLCENRIEMEKFNVPTQYRPYNEAFHHIYGYTLFQNKSTVPNVIKQTVRLHHENFDGTGPLKIRGENIFIFARIIRICDEFIRLITKTHKTFEFDTITEIIEYFTYYKGTLFDPELVDLFFKYIPIYPPGTGIILSDGRKAIVLKNNQEFPNRPLIVIDSEEELKLDLSDPSTYSLIITGLEIQKKESYHKR